MKKKTKYIISIIIDYLLLVSLIILIENVFNLSQYIKMYIYIPISVLIFFSQEVVFNGYSIGKFIMRIKAISLDKNFLLVLCNLYIRRLLEIMSIGPRRFKYDIFDQNNIDKKQVIYSLDRIFIQEKE